MFFSFLSDNVQSTSHDRKSACQLKGWRTVFDFLSATCEASSHSKDSERRLQAGARFNLSSAKIGIIWYFAIQGTK